MTVFSQFELLIRTQKSKELFEDSHGHDVLTLCKV